MPEVRAPYNSMPGPGSRASGGNAPKLAAVAETSPKCLSSSPTASSTDRHGAVSPAGVSRAEQVETQGELPLLTLHAADSEPPSFRDSVRSRFLGRFLESVQDTAAVTGARGYVKNVSERSFLGRFVSSKMEPVFGGAGRLVSSVINNIDDKIEKTVGLIGAKSNSLSGLSVRTPTLRYPILMIRHVATGVKEMCLTIVFIPSHCVIVIRKNSEAAVTFVSRLPRAVLNFTSPAPLVVCLSKFPSRIYSEFRSSIPTNLLMLPEAVSNGVSEFLDRRRVAMASIFNGVQMPWDRVHVAIKPLKFLLRWVERMWKNLTAYSSPAISNVRAFANRCIDGINHCLTRWDSSASAFFLSSPTVKDFAISLCQILAVPPAAVCLFLVGLCRHLGQLFRQGAHNSIESTKMAGSQLSYITTAVGERLEMLLNLALSSCQLLLERMPKAMQDFADQLRCPALVQGVNAEGQLAIMWAAVVRLAAASRFRRRKTAATC